MHRSAKKSALRFMKTNPDEWLKIFSQKPVNKPVDEKLATSNLWQVVEIDDEFITYHVSAGNPGHLPMETYRFKYAS